MRKSLIAILSLGVAAGCATTAQTWQIVGDDRPDGTVKLALQHGLLNPAPIDEAQALSTATASCRARGFAGAQAFGEAGSRCNAMNTYAQCIRVVVYRDYQCTGAGSPGNGAHAP